MESTSQFSQKFTIKKLLRFVYPSIIMMVFTSVYGVVDGVFVSNFAGDSAFAAVNLIMPVIMGFCSVGFMMGTGGSALVAKILGEGDKKRANAVFTLIFICTVALGLVVTAVGIATLRPLAVLLKAEQEGLLEECVLYGTINLAGITLFMLQSFFQSFFPVAEKPKLGLIFVVAAGVTNAVLDAILIAGFKLGIAGAAIATISGQAIGGLAPIIYFAVNRKCALTLTVPSRDIKSVFKAMLNGSSEMMTNLSLSLVNILYNYRLVLLVGKAGVEAYGVLMYVGFIFCSLFIGYSIGVNPIIGYNYGADNRAELKNLLKKSLIIITAASVAMFVLAYSLGYPLSYLFVGGSPQTFEITRHGFKIFSFTFLIMGFNIFGSAFFTALNNGVVSAAISFMRTLVFQVLCISVLPILWQLDGVWAANVFAELLSVILTSVLLLSFRKKYGY